MRFKTLNLLIILFLLSASFSLIIPKTKGIENEIYVKSTYYGHSDGSAEKPYTTINEALGFAEEGDTIYIFSDGYVDQFGGEKGKKFMTGSFKKLLLSMNKESMENQKQLLEESFEKWKGDLEQLDDVCVIGVRV